MSEFETIRYDIDDGLATITLARPAKLNAVNQAMFRELGDATETAAADKAVRAVLVTGDGPSFCAGIDLSLIGELAELAARASGDEGGFHTFVRGAQRAFRSLARMPKPAVAAVRGHALGAGLQLALACDLRIAATDANSPCSSRDTASSRTSVAFIAWSASLDPREPRSSCGPPERSRLRSRYGSGW